MHDKNVGLIGVGRLGLAYALVLEQHGFNVIASSYRRDYVTDLRAKKTASIEPGIKQALESSRNIRFTFDNHEVIDACDLIYVMVATPSTNDGDYDMSAVWQVAKDFAEHAAPVRGKIMMIGSTVNPGTTEQIQQYLQHSGVEVAYAPTFVAQGSVMKNIVDPHTLSIGTSNPDVFERCKNVLASIINPDTPIYNMRPRTAEILKLAGNCRATMEISFFNIIGQILIKQGLVDDLETANQYLNFLKPGARFRFGFGYGGPCYPRDNKAMVYFAHKNGLDYPIGELVDRFNQDHIDFLADYLWHCNPGIRPFWFDHLSYKSGVDMFDESQQLAVCQKLLARGARVQVQNSVFLTAEIKNSLTAEFPDAISFVDNAAAEVYRVAW